MWRKQLLDREKLNLWLRKSLNKHSSTYLSLSLKLKMVQDEQWRRTFVALLTLLLCSSHGLLHRSFLQQSSFVSSQSKIHRSHHCFYPKLLKTRVRVPLSSAISDGGILYNSLVSEVSQIYIFCYNSFLECTNC